MLDQSIPVVAAADSLHWEVSQHKKEKQDSLATSINLRRPRQFPLHQMLWQDFEDLIRDVGFKILGAALSPFKEGPDGGRDARFDGRAERLAQRARAGEGPVRPPVQTHQAGPAPVAPRRTLRGSFEKKSRK